MNIENLGWDEYFEKSYEEFLRNQVHEAVDPQDYRPGRVIVDFGVKLKVVGESGEILVNRPQAKGSLEFLVGVGDWIIYSSPDGGMTYVLAEVLPRKTKFSRAAAGTVTKEQIVAANMDVVFLVQSLNRDFNMKRLERYLVAAWESGATPVVLLTKSDSCEDYEEKKSHCGANSARGGGNPGFQRGRDWIRQGT